MKTIFTPRNTGNPTQEQPNTDPTALESMHDAAWKRYQAAEDAWYNATLNTLTREIMVEFEQAAKELNAIRRQLVGYSNPAVAALFVGGEK